MTAEPDCLVADHPTSRANSALPPVPARRIAVALSAWSFWYACYRGYYAFGGQFGLIGDPVSAAKFRAVNAFGAAVILVAAVIPLGCVRYHTLQRMLPVLGWAAAVGCCMHAVVDETLRTLSVTGVHPTQLPASVWLSFDRNAADLQDLVLNEPWFFVEAVLWAMLGAAYVRDSKRRVWWGSAAVACAVLIVVGVLSGLDVIGSFHLA